MLTTNARIDWYQIRYTLAGFDRLSFVRDITEAIPQDGSCQIAQLNFIGDGIQARGQLTIRMRHQQESRAILNRLWAVGGMVSVQTDQQTGANA